MRARCDPRIPPPPPVIKTIPAVAPPQCTPASAAPLYATQTLTPAEAQTQPLLQPLHQLVQQQAPQSARRARLEAQIELARNNGPSLTAASRSWFRARPQNAALFYTADVATMQPALRRGFTVRAAGAPPLVPSPPPRRRGVLADCVSYAAVGRHGGGVSSGGDEVSDDAARESTGAGFSGAMFSGNGPTGLGAGTGAGTGIGAGLGTFLTEASEGNAAHGVAQHRTTEATASVTATKTGLPSLYVRSLARTRAGARGRRRGTAPVLLQDDDASMIHTEAGLRVFSIFHKNQVPPHEHDQDPF